jgi:hypothetical protein
MLSLGLIIGLVLQLLALVGLFFVTLDFKDSVLVQQDYEEQCRQIFHETIHGVFLWSLVPLVVGTAFFAICFGTLGIGMAIGWVAGLIFALVLHISDLLVPALVRRWARPAR